MTMHAGWDTGGWPSSTWRPDSSRCRMATAASGSPSTAKFTTTGNCAAELERAGCSFKTHSDTEVLVHGYQVWGGAGLARRLQGLFAFGVYDCVKHALMLCRDQMGVKPLYWWSDGRTLVFASEIKALLCFPEISASKKVYRPAIAQYVVTRYASRPDTLFEKIQKLPGRLSDGIFLRRAGAAAGSLLGCALRSARSARRPGAGGTRCPAAAHGRHAIDVGCAARRAIVGRRRFQHGGGADGDHAA